ncbi:MAG: ABC-type transport auxiliary lipoprotein family protein [Pseudomonadota bacterium]
MIRPALAFAAALTVAGCASFDTLNAVATPSELYSLTPKSTFDPALPKVTEQIVVDVPTATAAVNTDRIAVQPSPLRVQYFPVARWVDRAPLFIQTLLIESFENSEKVGAVGRSTVGLRADYLIVTDIREFQAELPWKEAEKADGEQLRAHVRLNVKIVDAFADRIVASRSFTKRKRAATEEMDDVADAFDQALGSAMRDAVEWTIQEIAARPAPRRARF